MAKQKDVIRQIKKATRRQFSAEEKIRIVLEGLRGETAISEICRREGIASSVYYKWSKTFLEAGKNGLTRAIIRDATCEFSFICRYYVYIHPILSGHSIVHQAIQFRHNIFISAF